MQGDSEIKVKDLESCRHVIHMFRLDKKCDAN